MGNRPVDVSRIEQGASNALRTSLDPARPATICKAFSKHPMSKARELINAHLYPVLATFSVIYFAIQIAPIAQDARQRNECVKAAVEMGGNPVVMCGRR